MPTSMDVAVLEQNQNYLLREVRMRLPFISSAQRRELGVDYFIVLPKDSVQSTPPPSPPRVQKHNFCFQ